jgi:hypothetical protein
MFVGVYFLHILSPWKLLPDYTASHPDSVSVLVSIVGISLPTTPQSLHVVTNRGVAHSACPTSAASATLMGAPGAISKARNSKYVSCCCQLEVDCLLVLFLVCGSPMGKLIRLHYPRGGGGTGTGWIADECAGDLHATSRHSLLNMHVLGS